MSMAMIAAQPGWKVVFVMFNEADEARVSGEEDLLAWAFDCPRPPERVFNGNLLIDATPCIWSGSVREDDYFIQRPDGTLIATGLHHHINSREEMLRLAAEWRRLERGMKPNVEAQGRP